MMRGTPINLVGMRFGILMAVASLGNMGGKQGCHWSCKCDCGAVTVARTKDLRNGNTASCGCLKGRSGHKPGEGKGKGKGHKIPVLDLNRPWRKADHVDDRWLFMLGQRSPQGAAS